MGLKRPHTLQLFGAVGLSGRSQKLMEFFAGRIEGALFVFGRVAVKQWSFSAVDGGGDPFAGRPLSQFWCLVKFTDQLAAQQPQIVAMQVQGLARQPPSKQMQEEGLEHGNDFFAGHQVALFIVPDGRPPRQVRAPGRQLFVR